MTQFSVNSEGDNEDIILLNHMELLNIIPVIIDQVLCVNTEFL